MATRITATRGQNGGPDLVTMITIPDEAPRGGDGGSLMPARKTAAQERLEARRQQAKRPNVIDIEDGIDTWFVRTLSLPLLHELSLRAPRDEDGKLSLSDGDQYAQFLAAVLFVCLVKGKDDLAPYFEQNEQGWKDATEQANDAEMTETNSLLINASLLLTPDILPEAAAELNRAMDEKAALMEGEVDFLAPTAESPKSRAAKQKGGSKSTRRTTQAST